MFDFHRFYQKKELKWEAPANAKFIVNGTDASDIKQNQIGDCWFLAALGSLSHLEKRLHFVIQKKRNESVTPDKGYVYKFFKMGEWVTYKVREHFLLRHKLKTRNRLTSTYR